MSDEEFEAQATEVLTANAWRDISFRPRGYDPETAEGARGVNGRSARIELQCGGPNDDPMWLACINAKGAWVGTGRASTALEAVLAAQRDAVHTLNELAHLCGASFGRAP